MEAAWRFRIVVLAIVALVLFSDFLGNSGSVKGDISESNQVDGSPNTPNNIDINEKSTFDEFSSEAIEKRRNLARAQVSDAIKEFCLPKMLCEIASKPEYMLSDKEKDLLYLIRASTLAAGMGGATRKWHFAAHMGELMRYTGEETSGPIGCAHLWPNCPISSKKLSKLSYKVNF